MRGKYKNRKTLRKVDYNDGKKIILYGWTQRHMRGCDSSFSLLSGIL